jgi:hypothetical protein
MYTLTSALGKSLTGGQQWSAIDLGDMTFATVVGNYSTVYAILTNPFLPNPVSLNLSAILPNITNQKVTFNAYLTSIGNAALPTTPNIPVLETKYARYQDGFKAGYTIAPIGMTQAPTYPATIASKPDLMLTRANTNYTSFYQSCLVSVNGFFHMTDTDGKSGVWVDQGMQSCVLSKKNKLGILDFQDLGSLTLIPITADMIYKQNTNQSLSNHAYINAGQDLTQSTVMLVIGGYLHILDNKTFRLVGSESLMIDFNNYPLLERYYESKRFIDLSSLVMGAYPTNAEAISVEEVTSDAVMKELLTLSQSFIVLLNNTDISVNLKKVQAAKIPGLYVSYEKPQWPLLTGYGKVNEYWDIWEDGQWSLRVEDNFKDHFIFNTVDARQQLSVTNQRDPMRPYDISQGFFLQISSEISLTS